MSEYMQLIGADDVIRGGHLMNNAATDMRNAASSIDSSVDRLTRNLDDFLNRFEAILEKINNPPQVVNMCIGCNGPDIEIKNDPSGTLMKEKEDEAK